MLAAEASLRSAADHARSDAIVEASLLHAQKSAVVDAARRGLIDQSTAEEEIAAFDRALIHLSRDEGEP
ncbi:MAG: hypothetical protein U0359_02505 [Byssovorax sp.]